MSRERHLVEDVNISGSSKNLVKKGWMGLNGSVKMEDTPNGNFHGQDDDKPWNFLKIGAITGNYLIFRQTKTDLRTEKIYQIHLLVQPEKQVSQAPAIPDTSVSGVWWNKEQRPNVQRCQIGGSHFIVEQQHKCVDLNNQEKTGESKKRLWKESKLSFPSNSDLSLWLAWSGSESPISSHSSLR